jgi:hypothetical protein
LLEDGLVALLLEFKDIISEGGVHEACVSFMMEQISIILTRDFYCLFYSLPMVTL